mgnify:CR=1 FL=1
MMDFNELPEVDFPDEGVVRLMVLPNLVMFPRALQPIHIFEDRYRELVKDALDADRLFAMGTTSDRVIQAGGKMIETIEPHACLCRIVAHHRTIDGKYNLLVAGMRRIRLLDVMPSNTMYPILKVRVCNDELAADQEETQIKTLMHRLTEVVMGRLSDLPEAEEHFRQLLECNLPLGTMTDLAAFLLDFEKDVKLQLLAETDVITRANLLIDLLENPHQIPWLTPSGLLTFPPEFSVN